MKNVLLLAVLLNLVIPCDEGISTGGDNNNPIDTLACKWCGFSPIRVVAVVVPTREQLEAVHHAGAVTTPVLNRSRTPLIGQVELPMRKIVSARLRRGI